MMLLTTLLMLPLTACRLRFWEPLAPQRSFTPEDLLIDRDMVPLGWELTDPIFPAGDTLCTTECAEIRFTGTGEQGAIRGGTHSVYRYLSAGIARRTFEKVYLSALRRQASASGWTYQSRVAEQTYFGCYNTAGNVGVACEWAGRYEEYIVVLGIVMLPGEVSLASIEQIEEIVRAIDGRMAEYLGKPFESGD